MTKTEQIKPLLKALPDSMIAKELKCTKELVRQVRNREGIPSPYPYLRCSTLLTEELLEKAKQMYEEKGWSIKRVAKEVLGSEKHMMTLGKRFRERGWSRSKGSRIRKSDEYKEFLQIKDRHELSIYELFRRLKGRVSIMGLWRWKKLDGKKK